MDVILPETAILCLPFSTEPLSLWNSRTDVVLFHDAIYEPSIDPPFGRHLYREGKKRFRILAKQFAKYAHETSSGTEVSIQPINIPDFTEDPLFGKAAKYAIAWRCSVQSVLEESAFYSLAHVLESEEDINCSFLLASHLFYKQALQVLRSYLEDLILPIHFCENPQDFVNWKANSFRVPPLRGRDGILKMLVEKQIISTEIAYKVSTLYSDLNGSIHGNEKQFINKDIHTGSRLGLIFKYDAFSEWCEFLSQAIDIGIRLLKINYTQWEHIRAAKSDKLRSRGKVLCRVCHNEEDFDTSILSTKDFDIELFSPDGTWSKADSSFPGFMTFHCRQCGNETTVDLSTWRVET